MVGVGTTPRAMDLLFERERMNFLETLSGADASSGVPSTALSVVDAYPAPLRRVLSALKDTCALAFDRGYRGGGGGKQDFKVEECRWNLKDDQDDAMTSAVRALERLAIITMADVIA